MLKIDGHDNAIVGVVSRCGFDEILCYSVDLIVKDLMKDMSEIDAIDYFEFNIAGAYLGEGTPCFIRDVDIFDNAKMVADDMTDKEKARAEESIKATESTYVDKPTRTFDNPSRGWSE